VTPLARAAAVIAGVACLVLAGAEFVRQAALAADAGVVWPVSSWWAGLTGDPSWATTGVAAAVAAAVAVLLIVLAVRQVRGGRRPGIIEFPVEDGTARLSVPALGKVLRRRFQEMLPGAQVGDVAVSRDESGWSVRLEASVPMCDLHEVHDAALDAFRDDMRRIATIDLARLDLVVTSMRAKR
jgi:hypothetical protein